MLHVNTYERFSLLRFDRTHAGTYNEKCREQMLKWGDGARALCYYVNSSKSGHVFNLVNENGVIRMVDAQSGAIYTDREYIIDTGRPYIGIVRDAFYAGLIRTDQAQLTTKVMQYSKRR